MGVIYKITSPSGRIYVGQTYDLRKRINSHKCATRKGSNVILHNSIRKYGWSAHVLEVIEDVRDEKLDEREIFWIGELKTYCIDNPKGLNMTKGGLGHRSTWMHKIELRKQFSERFMGDKNPFFGKTHTESVKSTIGRKTSERNKKEGRIVPKWGAEKGRLKTIRPVALYDARGWLISEFDSYTNCAKHIGVKVGNIANAIKKGSWIAGKYKVVKIGDSALKQIDVDAVRFQNTKRPLVCHFNSYEIEYPSAAEASVDLNIPKTTINRAAQYNNGRPVRKGFIFKYKVA